jgi:hypothetical protein
MDVNNTPKVVRLRIKDGKVVQNCTCYIGRAIFRGGWNLKTHGDQAINLFKEYLKKKIIEDPEKWVIAILDLRGHTLGCWCKIPDKPDTPCHGDVLVEFFIRLNEIFTMEIKMKRIPNSKNS